MGIQQDVEIENHLVLQIVRDDNVIDNVHGHAAVGVKIDPRHLCDHFPRLYFAQFRALPHNTALTGSSARTTQIPLTLAL